MKLHGFFCITQLQTSKNYLLPGNHCTEPNNKTLDNNLQSKIVTDIRTLIKIVSSIKMLIFYI